MTAISEHMCATAQRGKVRSRCAGLLGGSCRDFETGGLHQTARRQCMMVAPWQPLAEVESREVLDRIHFTCAASSTNFACCRHGGRGVEPAGQHRGSADAEGRHARAPGARRPPAGDAQADAGAGGFLSAHQPPQSLQAALCGECWQSRPGAGHAAARLQASPLLGGIHSRDCSHPCGQPPNPLGSSCRRQASAWGR